MSGREALVKAWLDEKEPGSWEAHYEPLAIEDSIAAGSYFSSITYYFLYSIGDYLQALRYLSI